MVAGDLLGRLLLPPRLLAGGRPGQPLADHRHRHPGPGWLPWRETARGTAIASRELGRALIDFTSGKGHAVESDRLTADEKAALTEAYRRGTIDASQGA